MLSVSVIICTRKPREDYLRRVLDALRAQTLPKTQWELLLLSVAADGPLSDRFDLSWHPQARFILEEKIGKTHALMRGIAESKGELLAIVDDDNVLRADYLEAALKIGAEYPRLGAWGGSCLPDFEITPPAELQPWLGALVIEKLTTSYWAKIPRGGEALPPGAGMMVRRQQALHYRELVLLDSTRQSLGPNGQPGNGGEDSDLALCGFELGLGTGRFPELELTHLIPARKLTLPYLENLYGAFGYSGVILTAIHFKGEPIPGQLQAGTLRYWLLRAFLFVSGKNRVERRIRLAMERGRLRATNELKRMKRPRNVASDN
ncbi:MAG TPA: glycosyltransferase [Candidatus Acidoferrales bacterium]|nr:glycosyltransferase [Candidatus Acidoferrales bacterium]